jgi:hypothetical protein
METQVLQGHRTWSYGTMRQMTTHMSAYRKAHTTRLPMMPMGRSTDGFFT